MNVSLRFFADYDAIIGEDDAQFRAEAIDQIAKEVRLKRELVPLG